jgi:thiosulfate/3-mercaptopyruvate sulfurtransferase
MTNNALPLIIECDELVKQLDNDNILVVDLSKPEVWKQVHIPGSVHLNYSSIVRIEKPMMGLLPDAKTLSTTLAAIGVNQDTHIIACDDEGGGKAARLLWTLEAFGFTRYSLLNGGLIAWVNEGYPVSNKSTPHEPGNFSVSSRNEAVIAERDYIQKNIENADTTLLDARSTPEYSGAKAFAARGGHIPGAIHYDWIQLMDNTRHGRLHSEEILRQTLAEKGFDSDKEIICYCQTHHRSALSFIALKSLGYTKLRGYPGSWSDWGNNAETPIE